MNTTEMNKEFLLSEPSVTYGRLNIRPAKKVDPALKPRLYREVQKILSHVKKSFSDDIIEDRNS